MDIVNREWLDANSGRAYPFMEDMTLESADGSLRLPNSAILDVSMAVASYDGTLRAHMSGFSFAGGVATVAFADSEGSVLASATCSSAGSGPTAVDFYGTGVHDDLRGTVVFGDLASLSDRMPDGTWEFTAGSAALEPRCVRPSPPCVSGIYIVDRFRTFESKRLRGDVALIAGENIHLEYDGGRNAIVISADPNYSYAEKCRCGSGDTRAAVRTVNGMSVGSVRIEGDDCVEVKTDEDGRITISDKCSKPCCGCPELTFLNGKVNELVTALGKLESFSSTLDSKLNQFVANALASERSATRYV